MVTNNIRDLHPGRGVYCFVLNPQGRIQADLYCFQRSEYLLVETDASQARHLYELLDRYIVMDDVQLSDVSAQLTSIGLQGPKAHEILAKLDLATNLEPLEFRDQSWRGIDLALVRLDAEIAPEFEIWISGENSAVVWDALVAGGAKPAGAEAYELMRVWSGRPRFGADIRDRDLPQETGQQRALNFSKGCYVGQEIVERIRSRGLVHRHLIGFAIEGTPPTPGTKIQAGDRNVAEITSVATIPSGPTIALGYARSDAVKPGVVLEVNGTRARVQDLPFFRHQPAERAEQE
jgi:aminomethyltransferase